MIECTLGLLCVLGFLYGGNDPAYLIAAGLFAIAINLIFMKNKKQEEDQKWED